MGEKITVIGNVATVPEQRQLPGGGSVTSFRLAATTRRLDKNSSTWVDAYTNYFTVSAFRNLGEHVYRSLHRGDRVLVTGKFRLREWETDAKKGVSVEVDAEGIGHDLLFGTSVFARDAETSTAAPPAAREPSAAVAPDTVDAWAAPGEERDLATAGDTPF
jgi:single-strand DNA-binding protein